MIHINEADKNVLHENSTPDTLLNINGTIPSDGIRNNDTNHTKQPDDNNDVSNGTSNDSDELPEESSFNPSILQDHLSELKQRNRNDIPRLFPKNTLLGMAYNNMLEYDYLHNMETLTPELRPELKRLQKLITLLKASENSDAKVDLEEAIAEYNAVKRKMKYPDLKTQYKIIFIELILMLFKDIGYPVIWMKGNFYIWNGMHYSVIEHKTALISFMREAGLKSGIPKRIIKDADFLAKLLDQFISMASVTRADDDNNKILVNLLNGTLEIDEGSYYLRPHNTEDMLTYVLPFCFDPKASAPLWNKHLTRVLPDVSLQSLLAEHFGYTFIPTRVLKLEKVLVLFGDGANGKSVIHDVITKLMGESNITHYSLENLCDKSGYFRAMIDGKLLNYCSEISSNMNIEHFKKLASGEPMEVRSPYEKPYLMTEYAKLVFNCNILPWSIEHNLAYFRRLDILRFEITIPEEEQDKEFANKIIANELAGVFNWVLEGMTKLVKQRKFTVCEAAQEQMLQYQRESDPVQLFIEESGYVKDKVETMLIDDLFGRYDNYCRANGYKPCAKNTLSKRLKAIGFQFTRSSKASYIFIRQDGNPSVGL